MVHPLPFTVEEAYSTRSGTISILPVACRPGNSSPRILVCSFNTDDKLMSRKEQQSSLWLSQMVRSQTAPLGVSTIRSSGPRRIHPRPPPAMDRSRRTQELHSLVGETWWYRPLTRDVAVSSAKERGINLGLVLPSGQRRNQVRICLAMFDSVVYMELLLIFSFS